MYFPVDIILPSLRVVTHTIDASASKTSNKTSKLIQKLSEK